jgi:colanic acid biosynthesis glycosyl transferase WcaI
VASETPIIVTSVYGRVVDELSVAVGRAVGGEVELRTGMDAGTWAVARAGGALSSLLIRIRGYLFPLRIDLGPPDSDRVIVATTNPFMLPAIVALRRPRARLVTLVYDLYPESLDVRIRLPWPFKALLAGVTSFGLRRSAAVVFLGERTQQYVVERYSLNCPTAVIPPGCDEIPRPAVPPPTLESLARNLERKVVISYVGNMGSMHDSATLAAALEQVLEVRKARCALVLALRGDRAATLIKALAHRPEVTVLNRLEDAEWAWLTHRTDIALVSLAVRARLVSLPSKVFSSIAGGAAVLAVAPEDSDLAALVDDLSVGVVVPPGEPDLVAMRLVALIDEAPARDAFARSAAAASMRFTPEALAEGWRDLLAGLPRG